MIDERARRQAKKALSQAAEAVIRIQALEKQIRALEAAYDVSTAEHGGSSC